eukprot:UN00926
MSVDSDDGLLSECIYTPDLTRKDSTPTTLDDATVISALMPIQNGVKRFIDLKAEKWTPIDYDYEPDDTHWLKPKLLHPPKLSQQNQRKMSFKSVKTSAKKKRKKNGKKPHLSTCSLPLPLIKPHLTKTCSYSSYSSLSASMSPFATGGLFSDDDGDLIFSID